MTMNGIIALILHYYTDYIKICRPTMSNW